MGRFRGRNIVPIPWRDSTLNNSDEDKSRIILREGSEVDKKKLLTKTSVADP
jgi:hypothetical protein